MSRVLADLTGPGALYLLSGGVFLIGIVYDFWTLNDQISEENAA